MLVVLRPQAAWEWHVSVILKTIVPDRMRKNERIHDVLRNEGMISNSKHLKSQRVSQRVRALPALDKDRIGATQGSQQIDFA